ncbi:MAG: aminoglycoside phosphotransferase family protein [Planctomycetes bacterium]|nr:aminoglycoside phosphotransferase family protein [Planctomycetota bacterium]
MKSADQPMPHPRSQIYYWKCDRPAAFHGTEEQRRNIEEISAALHGAIQRRFATPSIELRSGGGQGNHATFFAVIDGVERFVRVDDGPEHDDYLDVESHVLGRVRELGLPAPLVLAVDATRREVPFAWHVIEKVDWPDLNQHWKRGVWDAESIAGEIGRSIARWQTIGVTGFGPFDPQQVRDHGRLVGFHASYEAYFRQHLARHLEFLVTRGFLREGLADEMRREIDRHSELLRLKQGCLVHKDLALWNILGSPSEIHALIDWDDTISGDPTDDISLLACFHDAPFLRNVVAGYEAVRPLPSDWRRRFWLHLLRNLLMKSVIRVGAGYFDRSDGFFLIGSGTSGADLQRFTLARLSAALEGLREDRPLESLDHA